MKNILLTLLAATLPFSTVSAEEIIGQWTPVQDVRKIEQFFAIDPTWADNVQQVMGGSGSGGVTGNQIFQYGGSGSGGVTGGTLILFGGSSGGTGTGSQLGDSDRLIPAGIYTIDSAETFEVLTEMGVTPIVLKPNQFYKKIELNGFERMGYFSGFEWVVSD